MKIFVSLIFILILLIVLNFSAGYINSRIRQKRKRDKKLKEFENEGYKISKRWDCNVMTIAIDTERKAIGCVVLGLTSKLYIIEKKDIAAKPEIKISGVIPKFTTNICVVFKCRDNNFYFLRTLSIKKGFGVPEKSKTAQTAVKQAEEILEVLKNF